MPPRQNPGWPQPQNGVVSWPLVRRTKQAPSLVQPEPSPLLEALKDYLESLP